MLGRRYFVRLAKDYASAKPPIENEGRYATWLHMVYLTANVCVEFAPNFDKARFLAACGIEEHAPVEAR
jgi:hypothetical protein